MDGHKVFEHTRFMSPNYSSFDLSRIRRTSLKMGPLVPVYLEEILPGDMFKVKSEIMLRLSPMVTPVMERVNVWMHYFFVPNRIIWNQWEDFITGGREGTSAPVFPTYQWEDLQPSPGGSGGDSSLVDYLGLPSAPFDGTSGQTISKLPFWAYQQIYNDYYRDQNLEEEIDYTGSGGLVLRNRAWEKDYFTSALPWTQRGAEVEIPLTGSGTATYNAVSDLYRSGGAAADGNLTADTGDLFDGTDNVRVENIDEITVDGINIDINELRRSSAIQRFLERNATGGARYIEMIYSHFGVKSSDSRQQRAEYLGGGRQPVVISEVLNTSNTAEAAQGTMAGHGIAVGGDNKFRRKFEEHGYVIGIMSVLPRTGYQQGIPKHFLRRDKLDYYWPDLANLGEQAIQNNELYFNDAASAATNEAAFGYTGRYNEYKFGMSTVHGEFRSTLDTWHMGRKFTGLPPLNNDFVKSDPTTRIFAVETGDTLWAQVYNEVHARRPMPFFADPRLS